MKLLAICGLAIAIACGVFLVVYGEGDDSPGAQGLGVLITLAGLVGIFKKIRKI